MLTNGQGKAEVCYLSWSPSELEHFLDSPPKLLLVAIGLITAENTSHLSLQVDAG